METILESKSSLFQRRSFATLSNFEKIAFLKSYLSLHLASFDGHPEKANFITKLISELDNDLVGADGKTRIAVLDYQAKSIFEKEEYITVFLKITNPEHPETGQEGVRGTSINLSGVESGEAPPLTDCHCGVKAASLCNFGFDCNQEYLKCKETTSGCYFLFLSPCDGLCQN